MRAADELIDLILKSSNLPSGKRRAEIQRELRSHIEDFVDAARETGRNPDEIEEMLLANLGDPGRIAQLFSWVYRHERRRLRAFAYAMSTVLLASALLAAILTMQAGLAFVFGTPIRKVLASRHTLIEALDILASVAAYLGVTSLEDLFESHRFLKAALLLAAIIAILMGFCASADLPMTFLLYGLVNGLFCRAVQRFITPLVARAGIVLICFPLAGLVLGLLRSPVSRVSLAATCASWLAVGVGYQLMTYFAERFDAGLRNSLQRMQTG